MDDWNRIKWSGVIEHPRIWKGCDGMASGTHNRGFASMDLNKQREIARKGGRAAHMKGTAHEFSADEAREAGRKGGERVATDRARMAEIGRRGGLISAARRAAKAASGGPGSQTAPDTNSPEGAWPTENNPGFGAT